MCGTFCYLCRTGSSPKCKQTIVNAALRTQHRGPDETHIIHGRLHGTIVDRFHLIFHRLMVNGLSPESGQPLVYPATGSTAPKRYLLCNGEIYNFKELIRKYKLESVYDSSSDCEIILHLYELYLTHQINTLSDMIMEMKGEFAFVLVDMEKCHIVAARDPLGVRSLYYSIDQDGYGFCSELKSLYPLASPASISQFPAGCYGVLNAGEPWTCSEQLQITRYYDVRAPRIFTINSMQEVSLELFRLLKQAVERRLMCDRQTMAGQTAIGAYLSGGFDSSAIAGILASIYPGKLHTFSIGFCDAPDLLAARKVAKYIGSIHHEVVVTEDEMIALLQEVPEIIESYDVTTNRASAFMLRLSRYIREHTDIIVVYSGEGSDELFGSYMYFHNAPSHTEFHAETIRLLHDLQYFDLLRGDKASAAAGLEIRVPFLDIDFVEYAISIPPHMKMYDGIEKYVLRHALAQTGLIPYDICWRTKEAMSDGVSLVSRSWSTVIQDYVTSGQQTRDRYVRLPDLDRHYAMDPISAEKQWFRSAFNSAYPGCEHTIPYEWLPKWCGDVKDASARVLEIYKKKNELQQCQ